MREKIADLGQVKTILIITILSVIASEILYMILGYFLVGSVHKIGFIISFVVPFILAPTTSWFTIGLLIKVHYLELEMRELATYDDLTKVMTRKAFLTNADVLYKLAKRDDSSLAILYIDIDDFKDINDKYGHDIGDKVLNSFGTVLRENKRASDLIGRLGGEEFAYILPETDSNGALKFANNLRNILKKQYLKNGNIEVHYSISIGISIFDSKNKVSLEELIKQSDESLYSAKHAGKDNIVLYDSNK